MAFYLVVRDTLGAVNGCYVTQFKAGETVKLDDADLAAVGLADGWLQLVGEASGAPQNDAYIDPASAPEDAAPVDGIRVEVVDPARWPVEPGAAAWGADRPKPGDVVMVDSETAEALLEQGIALAIETTNKPKRRKAKK